jgi:hypothetical protein
MCRPLFRCFFWVMLLGLPAPCLAQPSLPEDDLDLAGIDIKEMAKAAFEASQAAPRDLARARVEAVQTQLHFRYAYYRSGVDPFALSMLMEAVALLAEAEWVALEKPPLADRQAALALRWKFALSAEQITEALYRTGRVSLSDVMRAKRARLDAEIKLREAGAGKKLSDPFVPPLPLGLEGSFFEFHEKIIEEAAKSAFEAGQADLRDLARARRDAARIEFQVYYEKYLAGAQDVTDDLLLESAAHLAETELAALEKPTPADRLAVLAARWHAALVAEWITEAKYRVPRVSLADLMQARRARLESEIKLRRANAGRKLLDPFRMPSLPLGLEEPFFGSQEKEVAKRTFEAGHADLRDLAQARRDAIRTSFRVRYEKHRAGAQDATLDLLLEASRRLLEAELGDLDDPAEQLAAHERYWGIMLIAEKIVRAKYAAGRVGFVDYAQARYNRLDAEIRMREAREKRKEK